MEQTIFPEAIARNWPFIILGASIFFILLSITLFRIHAFVALISAAILVALLSAINPEATAVGQLFDLQKAISGVQDVSVGFGNTASGVALVIALAAIIGMCLMDSGAADQIVRKFMNVFGEKRAGFAMLASGFFLSIPVFFDTVFFLLIPLARMLGIRTGKNYLYYVMAIGGGGAITHSIVPPTPGPLLVGGELGLNLGTIMVAGFIAGIVPALAALGFAKFMNSVSPIEVRETAGSSMDDLHSSISKSDDELPSFALSVMPVLLPALLLATYSFIDMVEKHQIRGEYETTITAYAEDNEAPSEAITVAATPHLIALSEAIASQENSAAKQQYVADAQITIQNLLVLEENTDPEFESAAVLMMVANALDEAGEQTVAVSAQTMEALAAVQTGRKENYSTLHSVFGLLGDKVVALGIGALIAILIYMRQAGLGLKDLSGKWPGPLETAGVIILITCAGGAFGYMIRTTDIGPMINYYADQWDINYIVLAWAVTALIRIAQGSATVSMITGVGLMVSVLAGGAELEYHDLYIFLAIGFGSITCSWMNDSGFWIVGKLSGFTERETLKTWTPMLTIISLVGLLETWLCAKFFPLI